jgi:phospholipid/cholesterol/gamma-HCH transport system permease protein
MGRTPPLLFGFVLSTIGCYYGLTAHGGTQGVGRATTQAVVAASVVMLVVNLVYTRLLLSIFGMH